MTPLNLLDFFQFARSHGRRIALWAMGFALAGVLLSFLIPPVYQATAVILPPDEDDLTAAFSVSRRGMGALGGLGRLGGQYFTQADIAMATLKSRSVHERIVERFGLRRVYRTKTDDDALRALRGSTTIRISSDGTISVSVKDGKPERAADLANAYLAYLDEFNRGFRSSRARRTRQFLEERVTQTDSLLRVFEHKLLVYQARRGALVLSPESRAGTDAAASLMSQKITTEVDLQMLRGYASPGSEEVQRAERRLRELTRQLAEIPETQVGGAELIRQAAIQLSVLTVLTTQLEEARIREVMDTPTIQILDRAKAPTQKVWPRRSYIALFSAFVGAGIGILSALDRLRLPRRHA